MWPVAALLGIAVLLIWAAPRLLPGWAALRRVPGPALLLWQAVALAAVFCGLMLAPLAVMQLVRGASTGVPPPDESMTMLVLGLGVSGFLLARILLRGHRIGIALRRARREHAELVDLLGTSDRMGTADLLGTSLVGTADPEDARGLRVHVLAHSTPTAYCVPGRDERVVLTEGVLDALPPDQLAAVLAHERAHLRRRHDLVLEFFTVIDSTVPGMMRSRAGLGEVTLLIELLADRSAVQTTGPLPLARALTTLAGGAHPEATLGAGGVAEQRIRALADVRPHRALAASVLTLAGVVVGVPAVLVWGTLLGVLH